MKRDGEFREIPLSLQAESDLLTQIADGAFELCLLIFLVGGDGIDAVGGGIGFQGMPAPGEREETRKVRRPRLRIRL